MNWGDLFNNLANKKRTAPDGTPLDDNTYTPTLPYTSITGPGLNLPPVEDAPPVPATRIPNTPSPLDSPNLNVRPRMAAPAPAVLPEPGYVSQLAGTYDAAPGYNFSNPTTATPGLAPAADVTINKNPVDEQRMRNKYLKANGNPYPDLKYDDADKQNELEYLQKNSQGSKWKQVGKGLLTGMLLSGGRDWASMLGGAAAGGIWGGVDPTGVAKSNYDHFVFPKIEAQRMKEYEQAQQAQKAADADLKNRKTQAEIDQIGHNIKHVDTADEVGAKRLALDTARYSASAQLAAEKFKSESAKKDYTPQQVVRNGQSHVVFINKNDPTDVMDVGPSGQAASQMALAQFNQGQQNVRNTANNQVRVGVAAMGQAGQDRRQATKIAADDGGNDEELDGWMQALDDAKNSAMGDPLDAKTGKTKVSIQNAINKLKKYPNVTIGYDDKGWPYAQKTAGTQAPANQKVATSQMIQKYVADQAKAGVKLTPQQAAALFQTEGYTIR